MSEHDHNTLTEEQQAFIATFLTNMFEGKICPHCQAPIEKKEQVGCCVYAQPSALLWRSRPATK